MNIRKLVKTAIPYLYITSITFFALIFLLKVHYLTLNYKKLIVILRTEEDIDYNIPIKE